MGGRRVVRPRAGRRAYVGGRRPRPSTQSTRQRRPRRTPRSSARRLPCARATYSPACTTNCQHVDGERSASRVELQHTDVQASAAAVVSHQAGNDRASRRRVRRGGRASCLARVAQWSRDPPRRVDVCVTAGINERPAGHQQRSAHADQRSPAAATTPAAASAATSDRGHRLRTSGYSAVPMVTPRRTRAN